MKKSRFFALTLAILLLFSLSLAVNAASAPSETLDGALGGKTPLMNPEYITGGDGFNEKEGSASLLVYDEADDANEDGMFPKYCANSDNFPYFCEWKYDKAYVIDRIIIRTANDSEQYPRRPADGWTLSGSSDGENWTVIYTGKADDWEDANFTYYFIDIADNKDAYQYYQFNAEDYNPDQNDKIIQLSMVILCGTEPEPVPELPAAIPTASTVLVNGEETAFDAYNINGNNFFKLRDLAYVLNGTEKQFEVGWDEENNAISLTSGEAYTEVGGEMEGKGDGNQIATPTTAKVYLDGDEINLTAYNIGGNNYFKLRDIGQTFDFGVTWDGEKNTIVIDTSVGYTEE